MSHILSWLLALVELLYITFMHQLLLIAVIYIKSRKIDIAVNSY